jgi:octaprenyl-diphosphate synthase
MLTNPARRSSGRDGEAPSSAHGAPREEASPSAEPTAESARERLVRIRTLHGEDLLAVERELGMAVRNGVSPATDAAVHLLEAGGKRVRPMCVILAAACFGKVNAAVRAAAVASELVHVATLLHDDVLDDGRERRNRPTSRLLWGNANSVLAGDMLLTEALERTAAAAPPAVLSHLFVTLRRLVDGEILQLAGRATLEVDEPTYFRIVSNKTASLFEWAARAGAACTGASEAHCEALGEFGARTGLAFQLVDDVLDYSGDANTAGKALLADLTEGKLTLPLIRTLAETPSLRAAVDASRAGDAEAACRVAEAVRASGACQAVRALAREESLRALDPLTTLPPSTARDLLGAIARELSARAS